MTLTTTFKANAILIGILLVSLAYGFGLTGGLIYTAFVAVAWGAFAYMVRPR